VPKFHDGDREGMVKTLSAILLLTVLAHANEGAFAARATDVWDHYSKPITVPAPDGKNAVTAEYVPSGENKHLILTFKGAGEGTSLDIGRGIGAELLWSPDSRALAVTTSNGGRNGIFDTYVILLDQGHLKKSNLTPLIRKTFGHHVACAYPEPPNVAAVSWPTNGTLLVAAQIVNHSICDSFGTFVLYEVDIAKGTTVKQYDQLQAKQLFSSSLGTFLLSARDICISDAKKCEVPANHTSANAGHK
jgi:hypothetical protein